MISDALFDLLPTAGFLSFLGVQLVDFEVDPLPLLSETRRLSLGRALCADYIAFIY